MTTPSIAYNDYAYYWWLPSFYYNSEMIYSFHAMGAGGQILAVFPELDLVIVLTGGHYEHETIIDPYEIMSTYILPSVVFSQ